MKILPELSEKYNEIPKQLLTKLVNIVSEMNISVQQQRPVHEVEESLFEQLLDIGHASLQMFFDQTGNGYEGDKISLENGRQLKCLSKNQRHEYVSIFGSYHLELSVYGKKARMKHEYIPSAQRLQLPKSKFSYVLQDWDQRLAVEMPYAQVNETLSKILHLNQSPDSLRRLNRQMAESTDAFWDKQPVPASEDEGKIMVTTYDGKGCPIRTSKQERLIEDCQMESPRKTNRKKMSLIGIVYSIDPFVRTSADIVEALFRDPNDSTGQPQTRPKPVYKCIRASLDRDDQGTMQPAYDKIFGWAELEVRSRLTDNKQPVIAIMDGQKKLWDEQKLYLKDYHLIEIIDLIHVISYLWDAAHLFYPVKSSAAMGFVKDRVSRILNGQVKNVVKGLQWMGTHQKLSGKRIEKLDKIRNYLTNNENRMNYPLYLKEGYPIASGVIEGACRNLVKDRMERSGMRWVMTGAQAMLDLRSIHLCGLWDEYQSFFIQQEKIRLYPIKAANDEHSNNTQLKWA